MQAACVAFTYHSNGDVERVAHEFSRHLLDPWRNGGREHESLSRARDPLLHTPHLDQQDSVKLEKERLFCGEKRTYTCSSKPSCSRQSTSSRTKPLM